jgi:hypothetical protein
MGLFGGFDYRRQYGKQPHYALIESDLRRRQDLKIDI